MACHSLPRLLTGRLSGDLFIGLAPDLDLHLGAMHGNDDATTSRETSPGQACQVTTKTITSPIFITLRGHVVHVSYDFKLNNTINKYNDKLPKLVSSWVHTRK